MIKIDFKIIQIMGVILLLHFDLIAQNMAQVDKRPNIIFIITDDQRWDALSYTGNNIIHTPNVDELAEQGVYFKNAFVTTPHVSELTNKINI